MAEVFINDFSTTLAEPMTPSTATVVVATGVPSAFVGSQTRVRIDREVVLVTLTTATSWAVNSRAVEDSSRFPAESHPIGAPVEAVVTVAAIDAKISAATLGAGYSLLAGGNAFTGNQSIAGNLSLTGGALSHTGGSFTHTGSSSLVGNVAVTGSVVASATVTAALFSGSGASVTNLNMTNAASGTLALARGGTGQTSAATAINALVPTQTGNSGKVLTTDGSAVSWQAAGGGGSAGGSTSQVQFNNAGAFGGATALVYADSGSNPHLTITAQATTRVPLRLTGIAGQSAPYLHIRDNTGDQMFAVSAAGVVSAQGYSGPGGSLTGLNGSSVSTGTVALARGGTGAGTQNAALNNLLPTQASNNGKALVTNGTDAAWQTVSSSPAGSTSQVQFNNAGSFGGAAALSYAATGTHLLSTAQADDAVPVAVKARSGSTANSFEARSHADAVRFALGPAGQIKTNQTTAVSAFGGSIARSLALYDETGAAVGDVPVYLSGTDLVPPLQAGMVLVWREAWGGSAAATFDAATAGPWTDVTGSVVGGLSRGPFWLEGGEAVARSASLKWWPTAVHPAGGMDTFIATRAVPVDVRSSGCLSVWLRPTLRFGGGAQQGIFHLLHTSGAAWFDLLTKNGGSTGLRIQGVGAEPTVNAPAEITPDEWCHVWLAWGGGRLEVWVQASADAAPVNCWEGLWQQYGNVFDAVKVNVRGGANQPPMSGRMGPLTLYRASSISVARDGPADYAWPRDTPTEYVLDGVNGDDSNPAGPWATYQRFVDAVDACVVVGAADPILVDGVPTALADLATDDQKDGVAERAVAGAVAANGDVLRVRSGTYQAASGPDVQPPGIGLYADAGAVFVAADDMTASWDQPDAGGHPTVWRYTGAAGGTGRAVWAANGKAFEPVFAADLTAAYTLLDAGTYRQYADAGVSYVSLPGGTTPATSGYAPFKGTGRGVALRVGGWVVRGLTCDYFSEYIYTQTGSDRCRQANPFQVLEGDPPITVLIDCTARRYAKHAFSAALPGDCLYVLVRPAALLGPPMTDPAGGVGVYVGDYTVYVDQPVNAPTPSKVVTYYHRPRDPVSDEVQVAGSAAGAMGDAVHYVCHGIPSDTKCVGRTTVVDTYTDFNPDAPATTTSLTTHDEWFVLSSV